VYPLSSCTAILIRRSAVDLSLFLYFLIVYKVSPRYLSVIFAPVNIAICVRYHLTRAWRSLLRAVLASDKLADKSGILFDSPFLVLHIPMFILDCCLLRDGPSSPPPCHRCHAYCLFSTGNRHAAANPGSVSMFHSI
jgi:hypothetical protein